VEYTKLLVLPVPFTVMDCLNGTMLLTLVDSFLCNDIYVPLGLWAKFALARQKGNQPFILETVPLLLLTSPGDPDPSHLLAQCRRQKRRADAGGVCVHFPEIPGVCLPEGHRERGCTLHQVKSNITAYDMDILPLCMPE